jgi:hypothetical protein
MLVGTNRKLKSRRQRGVAVMGFEFSEYATVVAGRHHDGDVAVILCGGTNHGRSADINILHRVFQRAVGTCDGGLEGIQIHHDQIDGRDFVGRHHLIVCAAPAQDAPVNFWVQGFHATTHHLGEAGVVGDLHHAQPLLAEQPARAASRENLDVARRQCAGEINDAGFI